MITELYRTYAENIRVAAKQMGLGITELSAQTGYCYEHIRKIWMGRTPKRKDVRLTVSRECNDLLCQLLGLPAEEMFELAEREKFAQKNGFAPVRLPDPLGLQLEEAWESLDDQQKEILVRTAKSFAVEHSMVAAVR